MSTRQSNQVKAQKPVQQAIYCSGHCQTGHHSGCRGVYAGVDCVCVCHRTCGACGQALPETSRR
jgi:hypothetical protein